MPGTLLVTEETAHSPRVHSQRVELDSTMLVPRSILVLQTDSLAAWGNGLKPTCNVDAPKTHATRKRKIGAEDKAQHNAIYTHTALNHAAPQCRLSRNRPLNGQGENHRSLEEEHSVQGPGAGAGLLGFTNQLPHAPSGWLWTVTQCLYGPVPSSVNWDATSAWRHKDHMS